MRLGLFGGSFNPVHYGHLLVAELCREQCQLDEVWLMPAAVPPHKQTGTLAPGDARLQMLELALGGHEWLRASRLELDRGGVSYTVDTLQQLADADLTRELFLIMGADSLVDLPSWREPERISTLALPIVVSRGLDPEPRFDVLASLVGPDRAALAAQHQVHMPRIELSSTELRRRIAAGLSIRYQTPRAVEKYIETAGLYRTES